MNMDDPDEQPPRARFTIYFFQWPDSELEGLGFLV
jgi:hypothetical protein